MWLSIFTGNSHASNRPSCWPTKAPHSPATVKGFSGSACCRRRSVLGVGVKFSMGASQFCACTVAHIARKKIKVCPTLEAIRRIHLSPSRAMSRMLEHFSCRCRGAKDCPCGFSSRKSHAEYRFALRRNTKSALAPRSCLTQLTLLLAVLLQFLPAQAHAQAHTPEQQTAA